MPLGCLSTSPLVLNDFALTPADPHSQIFGTKGINPEMLQGGDQCLRLQGRRIGEVKTRGWLEKLVRRVGRNELDVLGAPGLKWAVRAIACLTNPREGQYRGVTEPEMFPSTGSRLTPFSERTVAGREGSYPATLVDARNPALARRASVRKSP